MNRPAISRAEIFAALAQGLEVSEILGRFSLTREDLHSLFQEVADHYRDQEMGSWTLYCDGASRGNPGPAGAGAVLWNPQGEPLVQVSQYLGVTTGNVAEYQALLLGLDAALGQGAHCIQIFADSQLMVEQLNGNYQVKSPRLFPFWERAKKALQKFKSYAISHVDRRDNHLADRLARQAIDHHQ